MAIHVVFVQTPKRVISISPNWISVFVFVRVGPNLDENVLGLCVRAFF